MRALLRGPIIDNVPLFGYVMSEDGALVLREGGQLPLTVDTGFSGALALPEELMARLDVQLHDYGVFIMGTGEELVLPIYQGRVLVGGKEYRTWFIPGDSLIGMELLSLLGTRLDLDLKKGEVDLY